MANKKKLYAELALKLRLEAKLKPELTRFFKMLARDFKTLYKLTGTVVNAEDYKGELETLLRQHYRRVAKAFSGSVINDIKANQQPIETKANLQDDINDRVRRLIIDEPDTRSNYITQTNQKDMDDYIEEAIILELIRRYKFSDKDTLTNLASSIKGTLANPVLTDSDKTAIINSAIRQTGATSQTDDEDLSLDINDLQDDVADMAQETFEDDIEGRVETIAITETQNSAEKTKQIEMAALAGSLDSDQTLQKQWVAILDERTRYAHAMADGQIVDVNEPFIVNNEKLMVPGDTSLGATIGNIINCRCTSVPVLNGE